MLRNFFKQTALSYPWTRDALKLTWICDACVEALGLERALEFLDQLRRDLQDQPLGGYRGRMASELPAHLERLRSEHYVSCALRGAVERYRRWDSTHADATAAAREQAILEMIDLYGLGPHPDIERYQLYARTWFRDAEEPVRRAFARLLDTLFRNPGRSPLDSVELSELHGLLTDPDDRRAFLRMAFPHTRTLQETQLIPVGGGEGRHVVVATAVTDKTGARYTVREPIEAAELGQLYRLFFESGYYRTISGDDRFLVALDDQERIIGGVSWSEVDAAVTHLNGIVVGTPLLGRGISSALIEDLCTRLANLGYRSVKTLFVLRPFFERHGFRLDRRWGGLVRPLDAE
jgi:GNAT superfamily N-acetyltransferase